MIYSTSFSPCPLLSLPLSLCFSVTPVFRLCLGLIPVILGSALRDQLLLVMLGGHIRCWELNLGLLMCKSRDLLAVRLTTLYYFCSLKENLVSLKNLLKICWLILRGQWIPNMVELPLYYWNKWEKRFVVYMFMNIFIVII